MLTRYHSHRRTAFTLIELLVVITLILVLATLAVLASNSISPRAKASRGAGMAQGWLFGAKQQAYRDRLVRGVQFIQDPTDGYVHTAQYVEQPPDYYDIRLRTGVPQAPGKPQVLLLNPILGGAIQMTEVCSVGDYIWVQGEVYQISGVHNDITPPTPSPNPPQPYLDLAQSLTQNVYSTYACRLIRQPRPVQGEELLQLPQDIVIDPNPFPQAKPATPPPMPPLVSNGFIAGYTVLFTPAGGCVPDAAGTGKYIFYVRDVTRDSPYEGEPTLITVFTRPGLIGATQVSPIGGDPYEFTREPRGL